jgi:thiol-disulfide isomerase/thioredoxin
MKTKVTLLITSFAFMATAVFAQSQRMVLAEEFTSSTCGPCAAQNPAFDALLNQNLDKVVSIKYHMSWPAPGNDPFYLDNESENNNRRGYYGINSVPHVHMDGSSWNGQPSQVTQSRINNMAAVPSPFEMQIQTQLSPNQDTIYVTTLVKATDAITNNLVVHNVVIEKYLHFDTPPGVNGEKDFYSVMKKMLPTASGTVLNAPINNGDYVIMQNSWALDYIYDITQLAVVGFIQNNMNKEVFQAALSSEDPLVPVYNLDAEVLDVQNVTTTNCFGSLSPKVTIRNNGQETLTSMTIEYSVNGGEVQSTDWTGSLDFLGTELIQLDELLFDVLDTNNLQIVGINPNGSGDDYTPNNTLDFEFTQAPNLSGAVNLFMLFDNEPSETTWELFNSAGDVIQSGGPYDTPGGMKIEALSVSDMDCYELVMYDAGGNGMCCDNGNGYYAVIYGNNQTAFEGSDFTDLDRNQFNFDPVGIGEKTVFNEMSVFPNPVSDVLNVSFNLFENSNVEIRVYDLLGKIVYENVEAFSQSGKKDYTLNLNDFESGVYLLKMNIGEKTYVEKISVK